MLTFLKIVGGFFVALVLFVLIVLVLGYLWLRSKLRGLAGKMADAAGEMVRLGRFLPPMRLKLEPIEDLEWDDAATAEAMAATLAEAGFVPAGAFVAQGHMPVKLLGFAHPGEAVYAVVYEIAPTGVWMDLVTKYADGTSLTYTTAKPTGMKRPPGKPIMHLPGLGAKELLDRFLADRPQGEKRPSPPGEFADRLQHAYAEEMDWMAERGGPSEEEIRAVAGADGSEVAPETVRLIQMGWRRHFNEFRAEQLRERLLATGGVSAAEWETIRERLVFVHDRLEADELLGYFGVAVAEDDEEPEDEEQDAEAERDEEEEAELRREKELRAIAASGCPAREAFARMNAAMPAARQYKKHGEVDQPLPADVWLQPEEE